MIKIPLLLRKVDARNNSGTLNRHKCSFVIDGNLLIFGVLIS